MKACLDASFVSRRSSIANDRQVQFAQLPFCGSHRKSRSTLIGLKSSATGCALRVFVLMRDCYEDEAVRVSHWTPRILLMAESSQPGRRFRLILFVGALALILISVGVAVFQPRPWIVPLPDRQRKNPLVATEANLATAKQIYHDKCANCHGDTGKGDGSDAMMYDPTPSDLTDTAKIDKLTDGEIFYQITQGRKPMPSFRKKLTEEQRWQLVLLVRWFARQSARPAGTATQKPQMPGQPK